MYDYDENAIVYSSDDVLIIILFREQLITG